MLSYITSARLFGAGSLIGALTLLFVVNILSHQTLQSSRIDLTENNIYTLSQGTRSVLSKLEEPVSVRYYLSRDLATALPPLKSYADRVRELLGEYERRSGGKLSVVEIDPEPFSEEEDRAVGYGLRGVPIDAGGSTSTLYFGLVGTNSTGLEEVIPYLALERESLLEYDLTKLVHNLGSNAKQYTVGVLSTLPISGAGPQAAMRGAMAPPWFVMEQIRQLFNIVDIDPKAEKLPEEADVLLLVHPKGLSDAMLYAIDQFVLGGGRALVFLDPNADSEQPQMMGGMPMPGDRNSRLEGLMPAWGLELEADTVVADLTLAASVRMERQGRLVTFEYPVWINTWPETFDQEDVITAHLGSVSFGTPGSLVAVEGAGTTVTPLIRTTDTAMRVPASKVALGADPQSLRNDYEPGSEALTLAARVQGKAKSAFPDGKPASPEPEEGAEGENSDAPAAQEAGAEANAEHIAEGEINLIVVADADMLSDRFWVRVQDFLGTRLATP
ncbi:MAG: GldG family protein, partial [Gammaproteobacteria bacterium]